MSRYNISLFYITNNNLSQFLRSRPHRTDCVINALEILKIVDSKNAGLMRIIMEEGHMGLNITTIQNIFTFLYPLNNWKFKMYDNIEKFTNKIVDNLERSHVVFCGITYKNNTNHVFLIGRSEEDSYLLIDGQTGICELTNKRCLDSLIAGKLWFILEFDGSRADMDCT